MVAFEKVLDGIARYIDREVIPNMNEWQEVLARVAVGRVFDNKEKLKDTLKNNGIIRTFAIIDDDGMVDVDALAADLKREVEKKGKVTVAIPIFGKLTFKASDVDMLNAVIKEER